MMMVLDPTKLEELRVVLGDDWLRKMLVKFLGDALGRVASLETSSVTFDDLHEHSHALISLAGHFGLIELSTLSTDLQTAATKHQGIDRVPDLRAAVDRAARAVTTLDLFQEQPL